MPPTRYAEALRRRAVNRARRRQELAALPPLVAVTATRVRAGALSATRVAAADSAEARAPRRADSTAAQVRGGSSETLPRLRWRHAKRDRGWDASGWRCGRPCSAS